MVCWCCAPASQAQAWPTSQKGNPVSENDEVACRDFWRGLIEFSLWAKSSGHGGQAYPIVHHLLDRRLD